MHYYQIAEITLKSTYVLPAFVSFACADTKPDMTLEKTDELPPAGKDCVSGTIVHRRLQDGWFFHSKETDQTGLYISEDYTYLKLLGNPYEDATETEERYIRIAIECLLIHRGYLSLHAAAVEYEGEVIAFTGPSGIGKSTRAYAWLDELNADLVSGDRPLVDARHGEIYGVPWDGKEACYRKVHYPLRAICDIRRSASVYIRNMSFSQRRLLLMRQCFLPMWDTETAAIQIANITQLAKNATIVRIFSGPGREDARALKNALQNHIFLQEEQDMKAKEDFVLRNVVDEYVLMPTGDNIVKFKGTVLLNEVSAFVWEKLQNPISKADLLQAILDEYEVDRSVASADLDALLATLKEYGVIESD